MTNTAATRGLSRIGLLLFVGAACLLFSLLRPETFPTWANATNIAVTYALTLMLALSVLLPLAVGEFDLSMAANFGLCHVLIAGLTLRDGQPLGMAIAVALLVGAGVGLLNGILVVKLKISSFVATLGTLTVIGGVIEGYTAGSQILEMPQTVNGVTVAYQMPSWYLSAGQGDFLGIGLPFWYAAALTLILGIVMGKTSYGRRIVATGGNAEAASLSGIRTDRVVISAFIFTGLICAIAAIVVTATLGRGLANISGAYLLPAYAGAFLGATTIIPGRFNAWGTFVGVYLVAICVSGLQQLGVNAWIQSVFNGAALILAVAASIALANRGPRRRRPKQPPHSHDRPHQIAAEPVAVATS